MKQTWIHDDIFLTNPDARKLYHDVASDLPIIDYHNHLNPRDIADNRKFENIAQLWVVSDPYKHRAMRISGIPEKYITGDASDKEKFAAWARTVPQTLGNPLFHWSALELKYYFQIDTLLNKETAESIWNVCNERLISEDFKAVSLLKRCKVELLCTSDDLLDDFTVHRKINAQNHGFRVLPSLRGDSMLALNSDWLEKLQTLTNAEIQCVDDYFAGIENRLNDLDEAGCLIADHALDNGFTFRTATKKDVAPIVQKWNGGFPLRVDSAAALKSFFLQYFAEHYSRLGWWMLLHLGAQRQTSTRLGNLAGSAGGYACMGDRPVIDQLCRFLDALERRHKLPRTILFNLNPNQNAALATITGSFAEDHIPGKIQFGPAWWYNDHKDGVEKHLLALSSYGLLSRFIGMTTDSRSILSLARHDYFRRILCNWIGKQIESGDMPKENTLIQTMIKNICYQNAKQWINKKQETHNDAT